ncbi:hypothetical protein PV328_002820 [Microctonus aethiopoides]|uniref:MICOS complex subunit MIC13 n=1 Tax=Microctonus aethiopoides TaxID=144406 RepID=A0AA39F797_9HYME|nr:hypothetical protein PV328_002820 [Microctonus aethiopoides]
MGIIRFAVKSSLAGGIVYYTIQEGLWSNADDTIKLYGKIYGNVAPYVKENIPKEVANEIPQLPSVGTMTNCAKGMWNNGVKTSIKFVSELPNHISNGVDSLIAMSGAKEAIEGIKTNGEPTKSQ